MHAVWVEIPVQDIERAARFYQAVFDLQPTEFGQDEVRRTTTLINTSEGGRPGISLTQNRSFLPGERGPLVYIDTGTDMSAHLARIESAGGTVIEPTTSMGQMGNYATFRDTEGNTLALYSYSPH